MKKITKHENGSLKVATLNDEPTRTDQTQKDHCDINIIMRKYGNNLRLVPEPIKGMQGDFSEIPSYQQMQQVIIDASNTFQKLPAQVRKKFQNDPAEMVKFLEDPSNNEEAIKLGLKIKPQEQRKSEAETYYANQNAKLKKASQKSSTGNTDSDD